LTLRPDARVARTAQPSTNCRHNGCQRQACQRAQRAPKVHATASQALRQSLLSWPDCRPRPLGALAACQSCWLGWLIERGVGPRQTRPRTARRASTSSPGLIAGPAIHWIRDWGRVPPLSRHAARSSLGRARRVMRLACTMYAASHGGSVRRADTSWSARMARAFGRGPPSHPLDDQLDRYSPGALPRTACGATSAPSCA
jgi:hypothetical protein